MVLSCILKVYVVLGYLFDEWGSLCVYCRQVKLWNTTSGFCFVTFTEHTSAVTAVTFNHTGQVVVSASGDGTVRAFDMHR